MMGNEDGGMMAMMWPWMLILAALAIAGLIALILVIIKLARGNSEHATGSRNAPGTARQILDERYAHGEIDHDEYRKRRETLQ
ncbi:SHOCT domain-containing protein [Arthrobacter sp.]|uniref:SHOCT domain-containing protein n=1 Tax=Arthrobacter sp. TaxID=1667 RepID=UPI003A90378A